MSNADPKRIYKEKTESTNEDIRLLAMQGAEEGTVVIAQEQTAGKGRRGRTWQTQPGTSLLFSLLLRPHMTPDKAPQITLLMAMAVTKAVMEVTGLEAMIKWPNDVVVRSKKICGILTEMQVKDGSIDFVVIGTGVNVDQTQMPEELRQSATSLRMECKRLKKDVAAGMSAVMAKREAEKEEPECIGTDGDYEISRENLLEKILKYFREYYDCFCKTGDLSVLLDEYNERLVSLDREVRVLDPKGEFTGISKGINEKGELLVALSDGKVEAVYAGEVSVRGLYGYI